MDLEDFQTVDGFGPWRWPRLRVGPHFHFGTFASRADFSAGLYPLVTTARQEWDYRVPLPAGPVVPSGQSPLGRSGSNPLHPRRIRGKRRSSLAGNGKHCPPHPRGPGRTATKFFPPPESARTILRSLEKRDWAQGDDLFSRPGTAPCKRVGPHGPAPGRASHWNRHGVRRGVGIFDHRNFAGP
jgi:hypothetical protein